MARSSLLRLARPMARRPGLIALTAVLVMALTGIGYVRFGVDAGTGLLVGSRSDAAQTYTSFSRDFGGDPIVVVLTTRHPSEMYRESNMTLLAALETDLARDDRVQSVLGPGTIAFASLQAASNEIASVGTEYGQFIGDLAVASAVAQGHIDTTKLTDQQKTQLSQQLQAGSQLAEAALASQVAVASADSVKARNDFNQKADRTAKLIDGAEKAAQDAAGGVQLPQLFAQFINRLQGKTANDDPATARTLFDEFSAAYGTCDQNIARALSVGTDCQSYLWSFFLDLPNCPTVAQFVADQTTFCPPKPQFAAVLRPPGDSAHPAEEIITVRLKPDQTNRGDAVTAVVDKIRSELTNGRPQAPNSQTPQTPLLPSDCVGATTSQQCRPFTVTIAGAPILAQGVTTVITHLLFALFPIAVLLMLVLLIAVFRVRGRIWPLLAAGLAALGTVGLALAFGIPVTPAVLAGVPVLVGLGVDYAVQMVARLAEERGRGLGVEAALREVLQGTGPTTLVAALATLAGLVSLGVIAGIDLGPLVAVPLVAEFSLVLAGGIVLAWGTAVLVALPAAAWQEKRRDGGVGRQLPPETTKTPPPPALRTAALATRWKAVLVPAAVVALLGWALIPRVPVQTDVESLLAPNLRELSDIDQVRALTGYGNEIDIYATGQVAGPYQQGVAVPTNIEWQGELARDIRCGHPDQVSQAISIVSILTARTASPTQSAAGDCVAPAAPPAAAPGATPAPGGSPSPAGSPAASPSSTAASSATPAPASSSPSPSARRPAGDVVAAARVQPAEAADTPAASGPATAAPSAPAPSAQPSAAPSPAGSPGAPAASPGASSPLGGETAPAAAQTAFVCTLRTFPALSTSLFAGFSAQTQPCPAIDVLSQLAIAADPSPVVPTATRIALGVNATKVSDEAALVDSIRDTINNPPANRTKPQGINQVAPTGLAVLAAQAYDTLTSRALFLNLLPLLVVALVLLAVHREPRRAFLPVLPTALAAGWAPLVVLLLGRLPRVGDTLGSLNPLTVVLGALIVALATEFGVVLLGRFYEERGRGLDPDAAAGAALHATGRAILVSAATLGAGFAVLAVSGLFPAGLPLIGVFGLTVVIDLALAVLAVFAVMLPVAVAIERVAPAPLPTAPARVAAFKPVAPTTRRPARPAAPRPVTEPAAPATEVEEGVDLEAVEARPDAVVEVAEPEAPPVEETSAARLPPAVEAPPPAPPAPTPATGHRLPGMSGRRRPHSGQPAPPLAEAPTPARGRLPGLSGRPRTAVPPPTPPTDTPGATPDAGEQLRRRRPGSVIPRRPAVPPSVTELEATPSVPAPPEPPQPEATRPDDASASPRPPDERPPGDQPRRSRRRRPPPSVRRHGPRPPSGPASG